MGIYQNYSSEIWEVAHEEWKPSCLVHVSVDHPIIKISIDQYILQ